MIVRWLIGILLVVLIVLGTSFTLLNAAPVEVNYYLGRTSAPLSLVLFMLFSVGLLMGGLLMLWPLIRLRLANHRLKRQLNRLEKQAST